MAAPFTPAVTIIEDSRNKVGIISFIGILFMIHGNNPLKMLKPELLLSILLLWKNRHVQA
jgi:hypothetical protein